MIQRNKRTLICVIFLSKSAVGSWLVTGCIGRKSFLGKACRDAVMLGWYFVPQVQQRSPTFPELRQPVSAQVWITVWLKALQLFPNWESYLSLSSGGRIFFHAFIAV